MTYEYDPEADAIYIRLRDVPYAFGQDLDHARRIDYGSDRQPIGVELLSVSKGVNLDDLPRRTEIERLLESHQIKVYA
ncbi:MAG: DUF2283 domain-containing protein [Chloroflexota bacterium]